jgi:hypothetical protein
MLLTLEVFEFLDEEISESAYRSRKLSMPISWRGALQQYVSRLHHLHVNKKEVRVYDCADVQVATLARMYEKRRSGYAALDYAIVDSFDD